MATLKKKVNFYQSAEGAEIKEMLKSMVSDTSYNTQSTYTADTNNYPNHQMPFVDKHMRYLSTHPALNPRQYVANLRLMTRIK